MSAPELFCVVASIVTAIALLVALSGWSDAKDALARERKRTHDLTLELQHLSKVLWEMQRTNWTNAGREKP